MKIQLKKEKKPFVPFTVEILFDNLDESKRTAQLLKSVLDDDDLDLGSTLNPLFKEIETNIETYIKQFEQ